MNTEILVAVKSVMFPPLASILIEFHFYIFFSKS